MNLEAYLISKKIDPTAFSKAEPALWEIWSKELEQMHPASFTAQKLYLINPIRRKYLLKSNPVSPEDNAKPESSDKLSDPSPSTESKPSIPPVASPKPSIPKPVFKPKPKIS